VGSIKKGFWKSANAIGDECELGKSTCACEREVEVQEERATEGGAKHSEDLLATGSFERQKGL
jgi:hypothetical protein